MSSNWSYLDNLNQGRQRRPRTSLEDLNRTLDDLESRIGGDRPGQGASREQDRRTRRLTGEYENDPFRDKAAHAPRESARSSLRSAMEWMVFESRSISAASSCPSGPELP